MPLTAPPGDLDFGYAYRNRQATRDATSRRESDFAARRERELATAKVDELLRNQTGEEVLLDESDRKRFSTKRDPDMVSVICPTGGHRHSFHPFLYRCFFQQTYRPRELIVVDTGSKPSEYFAKGPPASDPRVVYRHYPRTSRRQGWSIGSKRNIACRLATGSVIVHFDDDDIYAPGYVARMVRLLRDGQDLECLERSGSVQIERKWQTTPSWTCFGFAADAATLSLWHTFEASDEAIGVCDVEQEDQKHQREWLLGYGFSFVYIRDAWLRFPFEDVNLGEDFRFFESLLECGGRIALLGDVAGLCAHTHHHSNFSPWENISFLPEEELSESQRGLLEQGQKLLSTLRVPVSMLCAMKPERTSEELCALKDDVIELWTSRHMQKLFLEAHQTSGGDWKKAYATISLLGGNSQIPLMPKYGFEESRGGVVKSFRAWPVTPQKEPEAAFRDAIIQWLMSPKKQEETPLDEFTKNLLSDVPVRLPASALPSDPGPRFRLMIQAFDDVMSAARKRGWQVGAGWPPWDAPG